MKDLVKQYAERLIRERRRKRRRNVLLAFLCILTAGAVFWQLHGTGLAMENEYFCGEEEHQHGESCRKEVTVCGQEEDPAHVHTDACYESVLSCEIPEHTHTADCLTEDTADTVSAEDREAALPVIAGDSLDAMEEAGDSDGEISGYGMLPEQELPAIEEAPQAKTQAVSLDDYLEVFWTDENVTYFQGRDDAAIRALTGTWVFGFRLDTVREEVFLANGDYTCPLVLPEGNFQFTQSEGPIETQEGAIRMGEWKIEEGVLHITVSIPPEAIDAMGGMARQEVTIERADAEGDADVADAYIEKSGFLAAGSQKIVWTLSEVTIPRCSFLQDNGRSSVWSIRDEQIRLNGTYDLGNGMDQLEIRLQSSEYPDGAKRIPLIGEASQGDQIACALRKEDEQTVVLTFLNRCRCTEENCANFTTECENTRDQDGSPYTDADGARWCSCWQYPYNAVFTMTYQVDASEIWRWIAAAGTGGANSNVWNTATLEKNGGYEISASDTVKLERLISKKETQRPGAHDGIGTYEILINEKEYSLADTDCLVVTDTLTNLAHLVDIGENPTVTAGGKPLSLLDEREAAGLGREGNEDAYYSLSFTDTLSEGEEEGKTGEVMTIKIWYPTSQTYQIRYDATVIACTEENGGSYTNTATIQKASVTISGDMKESASFASWYAYGKKLLLTKTDADSGKILSQGAEFAFYRCGEDGEDTLLRSLTTDQEGKLEFHTDRSLGYVLAAGRLYCAVETKAPEGYEGSDRRYYFYFSEDGKSPDFLPEGVSLEDVFVSPVDEDGNASILLTVENQKSTPAGPLLPATGGPGTARFSFIGAALLLIALVMARARIRHFLRWLFAKLSQH